MDATPIVVTMITVGLTLVFAVAGAAWRVGMRVGTVQRKASTVATSGSENFASMSRTRAFGCTPTSRAFGPTSRLDSRTCEPK